ncbi:MAG: Dabb family protein [Verrucomicrobiota bacterium]
MVYFKLADRLPRTRTRFIDYCRKYLSRYPGQIHFSVGPRDVELQREVNARDFDVAMNMIFADKAAYEAYANADRHKEFIFQTAGMSTARKVYDSFIDKPAAKTKAK